MDFFTETLSKLDGGSLLDVATGAGSFAAALKETLHSFDTITAIDNSARAIERAKSAIDDPRIKFEQMDAAQMQFADETFDTVAIANSLHHFSEPTLVLGEMMRVLKPGGTFILFEMHQDDPTPEQLTAVLLHHWWGKIDTAGGVYHAATYTRQQLLDLLQPYHLKDQTVVDVKSLDDDPHDPALVTQLDGVIDQYFSKAAGLPLESEYRREGEALRQRVHEIGFHPATQLLFIGHKG